MKILVAGDYCPQNRAKFSIEKKDFSSVFADVKREMMDIDYSIVNLECPVSEYSATPIDKCGPNLRCNRAGVEALKWAGFNCVTLANNHFFDYGGDGVKETINACKEFGLAFVGGGEDLFVAAKPLYVDIDGNKLAIINCCEHEFSIATEKTPGSNPLNIVKQFYAIQEARKIADYVIVIVHGGVELFWLPSRRMIETYRFFVDAGADVVVNHHQHCYSGYEIYRGKPIFYGLGNFCFDANPDDYRWTSGYMVKINMEVANIHFELIPYRQCCQEANVRIVLGDEREAILNEVMMFNRIIDDDDIREEEYQRWCAQKEGMYQKALNLAYNRLTAWIFNSPLERKIISKRKLLQAMDYLVNESHIERMRMAIDRKIKTK